MPNIGRRSYEEAEKRPSDVNDKSFLEKNVEVAAYLKKHLILTPSVFSEVIKCL